MLTFDSPYIEIAYNPLTNQLLKISYVLVYFFRILFLLSLKPTATFLKIVKRDFPVAKLYMNHLSFGVRTNCPSNFGFVSKMVFEIFVTGRNLNWQYCIIISIRYKFLIYILIQSFVVTLKTKYLC